MTPLMVVFLWLVILCIGFLCFTLVVTIFYLFSLLLFCFCSIFLYFVSGLIFIFSVGSSNLFMFVYYSTLLIMVEETGKDVCVVRADNESTDLGFSSRFTNTHGQCGLVSLTSMPLLCRSYY